MIELDPVYFPLFTDKKHPIILITGGRGSGKTHAASTFIERLTFEFSKKYRKAHNVLYTRYTMVSAGMSIIPEMIEKIKADGVVKFFKSTKTDIVNRMTGSRIMFRGIHTSSGNQTAKLKSIAGVTTFVVDEAEEWVSYDEFEKVYLSMRQKGFQIRAIIIMNPSDSNHWVYEKYIKDTHKLVEFDGVPVQISTHPDVLHIHTIYLNNLKHLSETFIHSLEEMKKNDPERYAHIVMGRWDDVAEGAVFKKWGIVDEFPEYAQKVALGVDFGYTCFRGDTLITTLRGDIPICDVVVGDYVLTRYGYRRVIKKMHNGKKEVVGKELCIEGNRVKIFATEEHNFNVNGKWKKYGLLTEKDKLYVLLNLREKCIGGIRQGNIQNITTPAQRRMELPLGSCFTTRCIGNLLEKSRMGMSYIIKMGMPLIIHQITCSLLRLKNTLSCIKRKSRDLIWSIPTIGRKCASRRATGKNGENEYPKDLSQKRECAKAVERFLDQQTHIKSSVKSPVIGNGEKKLQSVSSSESVRCVEENIGQISIIPRSRAAKSVQIKQREITYCNEIRREVCDVYDLEIDGVHEYFANGILVHNCDESAIVRCGVIDKRLYFDEVCYKRDLRIEALSIELHKFPDLFSYAESADPRLLDELGLKGNIIYGVVKGPGSIIAGIEKMKEYEIFVTKRSVNLQDELRNYVWAKDRMGAYVNMPDTSNGHDHCFVGETLVSTNRGDVRIDSLKVGDEVLTSVGYKKVEKVFDNGIKDICEYRLRFENEDVIIRCTPDHRIKTTTGWKQVKDLQALDTLFLCNSSTIKGTPYTRGSDTTPEDAIDCIGMSGNFTMEQSQRDTMYITKMRTLSIMLSKTLSWFKERSIFNFTRKSICKKKEHLMRCKGASITQESSQTFGTAPSRGESGIDNTLMRLQKTESRRNLSANTATRNTKLSEWGSMSFVPTTAEHVGDTTPALTMRSEYAKCAERNMCATNTKRKDFAQEVVLVSIEKVQSTKGRVYDIQVEDMHEYFANGVLVHNCIDACRYWTSAVLLGKVQKPKAITKEDLGIY